MVYKICWANTNLALNFMKFWTFELKTIMKGYRSFLKSTIFGLINCYHFECNRIHEYNNKTHLSQNNM